MLGTWCLFLKHNSVLVKFKVTSAASTDSVDINHNVIYNLKSNADQKIRIFKKFIKALCTMVSVTPIRVKATYVIRLAERPPRRRRTRSTEAGSSMRLTPNCTPPVTLQSITRTWVLRLDSKLGYLKIKQILQHSKVGLTWASNSLQRFVNYVDAFYFENYGGSATCSPLVSVSAQRCSQRGDRSIIANQRLGRQWWGREILLLMVWFACTLSNLHK